MGTIIVATVVAGVLYGASVFKVRFRRRVSPSEGKEIGSKTREEEEATRRDNNNDACWWQ